jgi:hypothetical protein
LSNRLRREAQRAKESIVSRGFFPGNGLHAVEDYYSHSNFIEVALAQLVHDGELTSDNRLVAAMGHYIGVDPSKVQDRFGLPTVDRFGRPRIVTGTSVGWAANMVGLWETIKTEIKTGELRNAFVRGLAIRYGWHGIGGAGHFVLGKAGGTAGGLLGSIGGALCWVGGTIGGLFAGAGAGAASSWHSAKHWWQSRLQRSVVSSLGRRWAPYSALGRSSGECDRPINRSPGGPRLLLMSSDTA